ncbi:MAG TPA: helix-turn-helix domain-containing protein [Chloroflexia bacterium]|jgi:hypothetical protein
MADNGTPILSSRKQRALLAMMEGVDIRHAARQADVPERTLRRWLAEDIQFQTALREAESHAISLAATRLIGAADTAATTLLVLMLDEHMPPNVRLRATVAAFELIIKLREMTGLERRLVELEQLVAGEGSVGLVSVSQDRT